MVQPVAYTRYRQRVWTNANLAKDFVKVKTYSDLIVLKQDAHDRLGEPARWVFLRRTLTDRQIQVWTKLDQNNG